MMGGFFTDLEGWLSHPFRNAYPLWKIAAGLVIFAILLHVVLDHQNIFREYQEIIAEGIAS